MIPDPLAEKTVQSAVLDWTALGRDPGRSRLALVRDLLAVRRREDPAAIGQGRVSARPM